jgi:hypothetical protein
LVERNWRIEALGFQKILFNFDLFISEISLPLPLSLSLSLSVLVFWLSSSSLIR